VKVVWVKEVWVKEVWVKEVWELVQRGSQNKAAQ
jgi:hypothetical protein